MSEDKNRYEKGVGRITRLAYQLKIGEKLIDVDTLRSHFAAGVVKEALEKLNPPMTAAEAIWITGAVSLRGLDWNHNLLIDIALNPKPSPAPEPVTEDYYEWPGAD
jgi:hypothetical protein